MDEGTPISGAREWTWRTLARARWIWIALGAMALALLLDSTISHLAAPHYKYVKHHSDLAEEMKELGEYWVTVCVAVVLAVLHARRLWASALLLASGAIGGLFEVVFKWVAGRSRPINGEIINIDPFGFHFFRGGIEGFVHQRNLCFPSGHATLAFATAACLAYLCPRGRLLWYAAAVGVGVQRVGELAHYTSDIVAGAIFGIASFHIALRLFDTFDRKGQPRPLAASRATQSAAHQ